MKHSLFPAAAAALVLAAYTVGVSASPRWGDRLAVETRWPPRAEDIVNLEGTAELSGKKNFATVFKVPADRALF